MQWRHRLQSECSALCDEVTLAHAWRVVLDRVLEGRVFPGTRRFLERVAGS
jgi:hypothetical protein